MSRNCKCMPAANQSARAFGKIALSQRVAKSSAQNILINMSALTNGMYVVKLENDGIRLGVAKVLKI